MSVCGLCVCVLSFWWGAHADAREKSHYSLLYFIETVSVTESRIRLVGQQATAVLFFSTLHSTAVTAVNGQVQIVNMETRT